MSSEDYTYLFYDKAVGNDHGYNNKITKDVTIESMFTSDNQYFDGKDAIDEFNKFGGIYEIPENLDLKLYTPYLFHYSNSGAQVKITIIAINKKILEEIVVKKQKVPNKEFLITVCNYHILYNKASSGINILDKNSINNKIDEVVNNIIKNSMIPNADPTDPIEQQPSYATVNLYDYQKRTIRWMLNREHESECIYYNLNDETIIGNVVYDNIRQDFILAYDRQKLLFKGGALIDEVGLGKTYQMITLSLCNQSKNINYIQDRYEKIYSKATLIICPNQLGGQWVRELEKVIDKQYGLTVLPLFTKNHFDKYTYQDLLDADFVIASFTFLGNQCFLNPWISKLSTQKSYLSSSKYSHSDASSLIKKMSTEYKNKINDIIFEKSPNPLFIHWHRIVVDEFHELFTVTKYKYLNRLLPLFEGDFKWCMTATPFDKSQSCLINMVDFVTKYENNTGSSILINNNISNHLNKKFFRRNTKKSVISEYQLPPLKENVVILNFSKTEWMMYNAYLANHNIDRFSVLTRQLCCHPKIADEIKMTLSNCKTLEDIEKMMIKHYESQMKIAGSKVKYIEYRILLVQRRIKILEWKKQRGILRKMGYKVKVEFKNDIDDSEMKKLETELQNDPDFNGIFAGDTDDNKNPFEENSDDESDDEKNKKVFIISDENQDKIIKMIGDKLKNMPSVGIDNQREIEKNYKLRLTILQNDFKGKKSTYDYYHDVMSRLKKISENTKPKNDSDSDSEYDDSDSDSESDDENSEQCGICMGSIKGHDSGLTKCGHLFCYNCVKPFIEKQLKCPMCQKPVKSDEIYMITQPAPEEKIDKDFQDKQTLISKVGTKLANLIFFLKKNDKHSIIFSQWDDLLKKVGEVLDDYGIKNVFCKGNIWQRDKAIREFNSDKDIKVIMLSSESAASGTNLTKAEMVILLDPVYGTYEYRRNTEWQAIGRAYRMGQSKQVTVVRFVVKGTVEEEIYNMNKEQDKKANSETKIFELDDDTITLEKDKIDEIVDAAKEAAKKKEGKVPRKVSKVKTIQNKKVINSNNSEYDSESSDD